MSLCYSRHWTTLYHMFEVHKVFAPCPSKIPISVGKFPLVRLALIGGLESSNVGYWASPLSPLLHLKSWAISENISWSDQELCITDCPKDLEGRLDWSYQLIDVFWRALVVEISEEKEITVKNLEMSTTEPNLPAILS